MQHYLFYCLLAIYWEITNIFRFEFFQSHGYSALGNSSKYFKIFEIFVLFCCSSCSHFNGSNQLKLVCFQNIQKNDHTNCSSKHFSILLMHVSLGWRVSRQNLGIRTKAVGQMSNFKSIIGLNVTIYVWNWIMKDFFIALDIYFLYLRRFCDSYLLALTAPEQLIF